MPASTGSTQVTLELYDPEFGIGSGTGDFYGSSAHTGPFSTQFQLFNNTGSNLSFNLNPSNGMDALDRCSSASPGVTKGNMTFPASTTAAWYNNWTTLCVFTVPASVSNTLYPLVVSTPGTGVGTNQYAVRATTAVAPQPSVYAATSMSIYTNPTSSGDAGTACAPLCTASFYLASIPSAYAGHTLVIDLFDPGDGRAGANGYHMQFLAPPASPPATFANVPVPGTPTSCNYTDAVPTIPASSWPNFDSTCNIETQVPGGSAGGIYNGQWLEVRIALSPTYTCDTDCWWSVQYHFDSGSTPTDRTTWTVSLLGDPVHLTS